MKKFLKSILEYLSLGAVIICISSFMKYILSDSFNSTNHPTLVLIFGMIIIGILLYDGVKIIVDKLNTK